MENNEIMNYEDFGMDDAIVESKPGLSTGAAIGIGAGAVAAVFGGIWLAKKLKRYFAKQASENDEIVTIEDPAEN